MPVRSKLCDSRNITRGLLRLKWNWNGHTIIFFENVFLPLFKNGIGSKCLQHLPADRAIKPIGSGLQFRTSSAKGKTSPIWFVAHLADYDAAADDATKLAQNNGHWARADLAIIYKSANVKRWQRGGKWASKMIGSRMPLPNVEEAI